MKTGRISKRKSEPYRSLWTLAVEDIAKQLDRNPESIHKFIKKKLKWSNPN